MDFHDFHTFSEDFMRLHGFQGSEVWKRSNVCCRGPAPIETFTRSQLAAISWIFMDFYDFHKFSKDFMRFRVFQGSEVGDAAASCGGLCRRGPAPKETFARSQLAAISSIFMDFYDFHRFSRDLMDFAGRRFENLLDPVPSRSCPYRNLYSIPAACYFMDFYEFL